MARVPQEEIDRIKREVSIVRLVEAHGVELKPHGQDLIGRCPFHADKTPSLVVTPANNLWHCLGACNQGGSVIDWVMRAHGVRYRHAIEILRSNTMPAAPTRVAKAGTVPKLPPPVDFAADDWALRQQAVTYYHGTLKRSPEALAYLKSRGIASPELIDRFQLGFANRTFPLGLPDKNRQAGAQIREKLERVGILRATGHEHFNGSLVIPIVDEQGKVLGMYGRKITPRLRAGTPDHLYLKGEHRGVFNIQALADYPEIILCEALIDALSFVSAGFHNVTSSYGVCGFTPDHWEAFRRFKTQRILIAYDRDDAGDRAAAELAPKLMDAGIECFRVQFPRGMDANAYALKVQPATKSLGLAIRKAVWMGTGAAPATPPGLPRPDVSPPVEVRTPEITSPAPEPSPEPASLPPPPPPREPAPATRAPVPVSEARSTPTRTPDPDRKPRTAPASLDATPILEPTVLAPRAAVPAPVPARPVASPPASPLPPAPPAPPPYTHAGETVHVSLGDRHYRVVGLEKNVDVGVLKVHVFVVRGELFWNDTFDLCTAGRRAAFCRDAAFALGLADDDVRRDLGQVQLALADLREKIRQAALAPDAPDVTVTPEEEAAAFAFLRDPQLLDRILEDFLACGVVGEEINKLVGFLAAVSRNLDAPLAVVIQSSSAAGKSSLMEAILAFFPPEFYVKYSAMTGQSLFYMGETNLKHKILAIAEEEGAERASYALKLLQSEGELTIASTGKDPATGRHETHEYRVEGPVVIFLTTTAVLVDEELLNRCVILTVDENRAHTRSIHQVQRERQTLSGLLMKRDVSTIVKRHHIAQRLLRPLLVANPFAPQLTFRDDQTRMRRDHGKYLTLIRTIALLHQHQRPIRTVTHRGETIEYIEVTRDDIRVANRLAHEVLGRTLDELPPQTRRMLEQLNTWVTSQCGELKMSRADFRFYRWEVRTLGWGNTQAREHLDKLVEYEYLVVHRGTRGQTFVYELVYEGQGQDGERFVMGLTDPDTLLDPREYDAKLAGSERELAGEPRPRNGPKTAGWRTGVRGLAPASDEPSGEDDRKRAESTVPVEPGASYAPERPTHKDDAPKAELESIAKPDPEPAVAPATDPTIKPPHRS